MTIAIIGSGNVGSALAQRFLKAGHTVLIGARFPLSEKSQALAARLGEDRFVTPDRAAAAADVILITTPAAAVPAAAQELGDVTGKILVDATNVVGGKGPEGFRDGFEALQKWCPGAEVVKCFNSTGAENMLHPEGLDMFVAGNSVRGKAVATQLALDAGFEACYDFGGDDKVPLLESFALCWINLALMQGHGRNIAFKLLKRQER